MDRSLRGLYVPLITPFTDDGELAAQPLEELAHSVIDAGAAGLVALGTTAEARELGHRLAPLSAALFAESIPVVIKGVLHAQGKIPSPAVRLPLLPARPGTVREAMSLL